jgi:hypothetical protein
VSGQFQASAILTPGTLRIEDMVGPKTGLDAMTKGKIPASAGNRTLAIHPIAGHFTALFHNFV